jgi:predicted HTH transcriptional regulator
MQEIAIRKAQEVAFALIKIAAYIRRKELRQEIEQLAYQIIETVSFENTIAANLTIAALRNFLLLAKNLYELEINNYRILERELNNLQAQLVHLTPKADVNLETLFTNSVVVKSKEQKKTPALLDEIVVSDSEIPSIREDGGQDGNLNDIDNEAESGNEFPARESARRHQDFAGQTGEAREEKILAMISAAVGHRLQLRDFLAAFPNISERTIRYDLKRLADSGKIERQGSGGPSNFYALRVS